MIFDKLFKKKKQTQVHEEIKPEPVKPSISVEETISSMANKKDSSSNDIDTFLEGFFELDKYYYFMISKVPQAPQEYIQVIDEKLSSLIFTNKNQIEDYIKNELSVVEKNVVICENAPADIFQHIERLNKIDVERILFNYPTEWISFDFK